MKTHVLITLGFWGALALAASAQTISNPSFEANSFTNGSGTIAANGPIVGWTATDTNRAGLNPVSGGTDHNHCADNGAVPDGANVAFIQGGPNSSFSSVGLKLMSRLRTALGMSAPVPGTPIAQFATDDPRGSLEPGVFREGAENRQWLPPRGLSPACLPLRTVP
jgi:hypothetical protein